MKHRIWIVIGLCAFALSLSAEVKLPAFFSNGMVMQQQTQAALWGTASPEKTVKIITGWNHKSYSVKSDAKGNWRCSVATPAAGGPYVITFNDGKSTEIRDIWMGELWVCSGQSNMEMPMKGFKNQPVENANADVMKSKNTALRLFTVKRHAALLPEYDVTGNWSEANPESVREFSATAYYFGRMLQEQLGVPVGLIVTSWGGSACEAWMKPEWLKAFPNAKIPVVESDIKSENRTPTVLYNGMLHPLIGMAMRGVIWYQGEDNYNRASTYADMFSNLINGWRAEWKIGDFPFYYCQIAPFDYGIITERGQEPINSAYLREQQAKVERSVSNSGMAVLLDVGMEKGIHPAKKQVAGERLARLSLVKTYGMKGVTAESPYYAGMEVKNDTVIVSFDRAPMWINCKEKFESDHFKVAGSDKVFYPAKTWIVRGKMYVKSEAVKHPVAVRYGFENYVEGDLFGEDLPVSSFRSDNW